MKKELEELLKLLESKKSKDDKARKDYYNANQYENSQYHDGRYTAFDFAIGRLSEILNDKRSVK